MKVYKAMFEAVSCTNTNDRPCSTGAIYRGLCTHPRMSTMQQIGPVATSKSGPQQRCTAFVNKGTFAMVYEADVLEWTPTLSDDEQAVLRVGGSKALRKVLDAKAREEARAAHYRVVDLCSCGVPWPCPARGVKSDVKHAPADPQPSWLSETTKANGYVVCICGSYWSHRCSKLKKVLKAQAKAAA